MSNYWNALFYMKADYDGFAVPVSAGGRGPENAAEVLGLEIDHHAGQRAVVIQPGETVEQAAYRHMRETHTFLTDDNHTWEIEWGEKPDWMSRVQVTKNEKSGYFAFNPWGSRDGPGAPWFDMRFRVATVGMIAAEIEADRVSAEKYDAQAASRRDSKAGRKQAKTDRYCAHSARWRGEVAPGRRWPNHFPVEAKAA